MSKHPENIKEINGDVVEKQHFYVIDNQGTKWTAPADLIQKVKLFVEARALSKVLSEIEASQDIVEDYPETPNLFKYLLSENNAWLLEQLNEGADEETIQKQLKSLFFKYAFDGAVDGQVLAGALEKIGDLSQYDWVETK